MMEVKRRQKEEEEKKRREEEEQQKLLSEKQVEIQKIRAQNEEKLNQSKFQKLSESIK